MLSWHKLAGLSAVLFPQHYGDAYKEAKANGLSGEKADDYAVGTAIKRTLLDSLSTLVGNYGLGVTEKLVGKALAKVGPKKPLSNTVEEGVEAGIAGRNGKGYNGSKVGVENLPEYPGNNPYKQPLPDYEWRGDSQKGSWFNPKTSEVLRSDIEHGGLIRPHWDYRGPDGKWYRLFSDGHIEPKS